MPTYDYECPACGHAFEVFQRMSDDPGAECPECKTAAERKISGGAGFLFKGDGFYITDYRSEDYKKKAAADVGDAKPDKTTGKKDSGSESSSAPSSSSKDPSSKTSTPGTSSTTSSSDD